MLCFVLLWLWCQYLVYSCGTWIYRSPYKILMCSWYLAGHNDWNNADDREFSNIDCWTLQTWFEQLNMVYTLKSTQNGCHFADDILKSISLYENCCIWIQIYCYIYVTSNIIQFTPNRNALYHLTLHNISHNIQQQNNEEFAEHSNIFPATFSVIINLNAWLKFASLH